MAQQKRIQAQVLQTQGETVVASGWVTLYYVQPQALATVATEIQAVIEFDHDRVDLAGRTLRLRFNDKVSGLVTIRPSKGQQPVFTALRRFHLEWQDDRWKDLKWYEEV